MSQAIAFDPAVTQDLEAASSREWLETNGLGGWASSTICGMNTRRYHGLLVCATRPPVGRRVLLSKLDESVSSGGSWYSLGCNRFTGAVHPEGHHHLVSFAIDPFPRFEYVVGDIRIEKTVAAVRGENTTLVIYRVIEAPGPVDLVLKPLVADRDFHALTRAGAVVPPVEFHDGVLTVPSRAIGPALHLAVPGAEFLEEPDWWYGFQYERERERGFDFTEDLHMPGVLRVRIRRGGKLGVIASTTEPKGRDASKLLARERSRRERRLTSLPAAVSADPVAVILAGAVDSFIVQRWESLATVIAGYPWFADWGRDAMASLPGACLVTGRLDEAKKILDAFVTEEQDGLLPGRFYDEGEAAEYSAVDPSLWCFVATRAYLEAGGREVFVKRQIYPVMKEIIARYTEGVRPGIRETEDGLLEAGAPGLALTWMDAHVRDRAVTPRCGKAVEVNALWYNALSILGELAERFGDGELAADLAARAARTRRSFGKVFWNEEAGCLFDVVAGDTPDASIRPNQILALSLPHALLGAGRARQVLDVVTEKLLTPSGLRTLSPDDPAYVPRYLGGPIARDGARHQGTVWPWLLGPYATALTRFKGAAGRKAAREAIEALLPQLEQAGLGHLSEICDAEPPHAPRGCPAQAWSAAEVLRAWVEDVLGAGAKPKAAKAAPAKKKAAAKQSPPPRKKTTRKKRR